MKRSLGVIGVIVFLAGLSLTFGCATVTSVSHKAMPSEKSIMVSPWRNYQEAEIAFNSIVPGKTTLEDLKKTGFNSTAPNVTFLDPLTIRDLFLGTNSSVKMEDLPPAIQEYLKDMANCRGYKFKCESIDTQGQGDIFKRILKFRKEDFITGWQFEAWIFLRKDTVVYLLWKGTPNISQIKMQKNPLGPFGDILGNSPKIIMDMM